MTQLTKTTSSVGYSIQYAYNYAGELTQVTYPSGRAVAQSFDVIGRLTQISSGGTNYLSGVAYNAAFEPTGWSYGNGVQASLGYNSRFQLQSLAYTNGASTLFSLNYSYTADPVSCPGVTAGNNGQIQRITDNVDGTRTTNYCHDAWARLKSASNAQWTVTETYDRYGNRKSQTPPPNNSVTVDPNTNRLTDPGYAYDLAGNMTNDGLNTMTYNGESRVVTSATGGITTTNSYDGNGLRVKKQVGAATPTVYIFSGAKVIAEYASGAAATSPQREYIYSGSQLLARIEGTATSYYHADHLSVRTITDSSGAVTEQKGHFPFGENWYGGTNSDKWRFTSYERDGGSGESGNDYAMMRSYVNRLARFSSPDPIAGSIADPQSLNRYAYARNDPVNVTDPLGLCVCAQYYVCTEYPHDCRIITICFGDDCGGGGGGGGGRGGDGDCAGGVECEPPQRPIGGDEKKEKKINPGQKLIDDALKAFEDCVRQGLGIKAQAKEVLKDALKNLFGADKKKVNPQKIFDEARSKAQNGLTRVEEDCARKNPLAVLAPTGPPARFANPPLFPSDPLAPN